MKVSPILAVVLALILLSIPACNVQRKVRRQEAPKIVAGSPQSKSVTLTQEYVCELHSQRRVKLRCLEKGRLETIAIKEGQAVMEGDLMFKIIPTVQPKRVPAEAEFKIIPIFQPKRRPAEAEFKIIPIPFPPKAQPAEAEMFFATVKAPFDGVVGGLQLQQGSLVEEGEILATLSDDSLMWAYFNVPEARYLEYMADLNQHLEDLRMELVLANGDTFPHSGTFGALKAEFNSQTGNIPFRADFPNPDRRLHHGQSGTVLIHRVQKDAIVIPQRATFEVLDKRYVYVVDKDDVAHQREIVIEDELDDLFVVKQGIDVEDKIVVEGMRHVRDGEKVEFAVN